MRRRKLIARKSSLKVVRPKPVKKANPARRARAMVRAYHSLERVEFIQSLACVCCGVWGHSENAHIAGGGMGRKAEYTKIVPLCGPRFSGVTEVEGCHARLHRWGREKFERSGCPCGSISLDLKARWTEERWQSHLAESYR